MVNQKKKTSRMDLAIPADHREELKEGEQRDKYLDLARKLKRKIKTMEHKSEGDTSCNWCALYSKQIIVIGTGGLGNKRTRGDHPNCSIVEIGQDIEKNPRDLRSLAVIQSNENLSANTGGKNS